MSKPTKPDRRKYAIAIIETETGIYPKCIVGEYEQRNDYQNGWNDAVMAVNQEATKIIKETSPEVTPEPVFAHDSKTDPPVGDKDLLVKWTGDEDLSQWYEFESRKVREQPDSFPKWIDPADLDRLPVKRKET